jgi:hypothetical protein
MSQPCNQYHDKVHSLPTLYRGGTVKPDSLAGCHFVSLYRYQSTRSAINTALHGAELNSLSRNDEYHRALEHPTTTRHIGFYLPCTKSETIQSLHAVHVLKDRRFSSEEQDCGYVEAACTALRVSQSLCGTLRASP